MSESHFFKVLFLNYFQKKVKKNAALPWEGLRQINSTSNGSFTDVIREEILALSQVFILFLNLFFFMQMADFEFLLLVKVF